VVAVVTVVVATNNSAPSGHTVRSPDAGTGVLSGTSSTTQLSHSTGHWTFKTGKRAQAASLVGHDSGSATPLHVEMPLKSVVVGVNVAEVVVTSAGTQMFDSANLQGPSVSYPQSSAGQS